MSRNWAQFIFASFAALFAASNALKADTVPVSRVTLYPGTIVTSEILTTREFPRPVVDLGFIGQADELIGKMVFRTILPNQPILKASVREPYLVRQGKTVRTRFQAAGLEISGWGVALEAGSSGEIISARNPDTGIIVRGILQPDGSLVVPPS